MEANEPKKEQNTEEMDVMKQFMELLGQAGHERAVTGLYGGLAVYRRDAVTAFRYGGRTARSTEAA